MPIETEVIFCRCQSPEHQIILRYFSDDEPIEKEVYVHIHLNDYRNFFKRLVAGVKYIFGYRSKYGEWDEVILSPEVVQELVAYFEKFLQEKGNSSTDESSA